jgi:hypothetical protein
MQNDPNSNLLLFSSNEEILASPTNQLLSRDLKYLMQEELVCDVLTKLFRQHGVHLQQYLLQHYDAVLLI